MSAGVDSREALIRFVDEANRKLWTLVTRQGDFDPAELGRQVIDKAEKAGYTFGKALGMLNMARGLFIIQHDSENSLKMIAEAANIFRSLDNKKWIANAYLIEAIINNTIGRREAALYAALRGIDFYHTHPEEPEDREMAYYILATVYKDLGKFDEAEQFYKKGIAAATEPGSWVHRIKTSLSGIYSAQEKYQEALALSLDALAAMRSERNVIAESRALTDVGVIYKKLRQYDKALAHLQQGLKLREENGIKHFMLTSLLEIADLYMETDRPEEAVKYLKKAEAVALEIRLQAKLAVIYKELSAAYKQLADYREALAYSEKFLALTQEITRTEAEKRISELHSNLLQEKEQEIERLRNVELKNAYQIISEKQKEILDSIHYARRIQQSLLPNEKLIQSLILRASGKS